MINIGIAKKYKPLLSDKDAFYAEAEKLNITHKKLNLPDYYHLGNLNLDSNFAEIGESDKFFTTSHLPWNRNLTDYEKNAELHMLSYKKDSVQWNEVKEKLNLKCFTLVKNTQIPGEVAGVHMDISSGFTFKTIEKEYEDFTTSDLKRYIIFLNDWTLGQIFMFPNSNVIKWKKFDIISFPWYMYHATANASKINKEILLATGI